jgi:hypothetical protein
MSTLTLPIKTLKGSNFTVEVSSTGSVADLQSAIHSSQAIPPERQRLIYQGKVLKPEKPLAEYKIEDGNAVHLVVRDESAPLPPSSAPSVSSSSAAPSLTFSSPSPDVMIGSMEVDLSNGLSDLNSLLSNVLNQIGLPQSSTSSSPSSSSAPPLTVTNVNGTPTLTAPVFPGPVNINSVRESINGICSSISSQLPLSVLSSVPSPYVIPTVETPYEESINGIAQELQYFSRVLGAAANRADELSRSLLAQQASDFPSSDRLRLQEQTAEYGLMIRRLCSTLSGQGRLLAQISPAPQPSDPLVLLDHPIGAGAQPILGGPSNAVQVMLAQPTIHISAAPVDNSASNPITAPTPSVPAPVAALVNNSTPSAGQSSNAPSAAAPPNPFAGLLSMLTGGQNAGASAAAPGSAAQPNPLAGLLNMMNQANQAQRPATQPQTQTPVSAPVAAPAAAPVSAPPASQPQQPNISGLMNLLGPMMSSLGNARNAPNASQPASGAPPNLFNMLGSLMGGNGGSLGDMLGDDGEEEEEDGSIMTLFITRVVRALQMPDLMGLMSGNFAPLDKAEPGLYELIMEYTNDNPSHQACEQVADELTESVIEEMLCPAVLDQFQSTRIPGKNPAEVSRPLLKSGFTRLFVLIAQRRGSRPSGAEPFHVILKSLGLELCADFLDGLTSCFSDGMTTVQSLIKAAVSQKLSTMGPEMQMFGPMISGAVSGAILKASREGHQARLLSRSAGQEAWLEQVPQNERDYWKRTIENDVKTQEALFQRENSRPFSVVAVQNQRRKMHRQDDEKSLYRPLSPAYSGAKRQKNQSAEEEKKEKEKNESKEGVSELLFDRAREVVNGVEKAMGEEQSETAPLRGSIQNSNLAELYAVHLTSQIRSRLAHDEDYQAIKQNSNSKVNVDALDQITKQ